MTGQLYEFFPPGELVCHCGCGKGQERMDREFMGKLIAMRRAAGFPFLLSSAYRCPEYNMRVSTTGAKGPHTTGHAVDVHVPWFRVYRFLELFYAHGMTGFGDGMHKGFIHVDDLSAAEGFPMRPNAWGY